jgi:hypothetical protein
MRKTEGDVSSGDGGVCCLCFVGECWSGHWLNYCV